MGRLLRDSSEDHLELRSHHLIGRDPSCHLRLVRPEVSGVHAAIRWSMRGWELRDLGSRNGTLVDGRTVTPGEWVPLSEGSQLAFGHPDVRWTLSSAAAPLARAFPVDGGPALQERGGLLSLPSAADPQVLIHRSTNGEWVVEDPDGTGPPPEDAVLRLGEQAWVLELPELDPRTPMSREASLADASLYFQVSLDEEYVEVEVEVAGKRHALRPRAHHYLLLTLARLRLEDAAVDPDAPASHGWVAMEQLTGMLRMGERPLNLQIFRIRQEFAELGLREAQDIVQRRRGTGQLRLYVGAVHVSTLGEIPTTG